MNRNIQLIVDNGACRQSSWPATQDATRANEGLQAFADGTRLAEAAARIDLPVDPSSQRFVLLKKLCLLEAAAKMMSEAVQLFKPDGPPRRPIA